MTRNFVRNLLLLAGLLLLCAHFSKADDSSTPADSEDADSSSEATEEDSNETTSQSPPARRRRRAVSDAPPNLQDDAPIQRIGIPGLPDPATIIKIAEIVQQVGETVIPMLIQGNDMGATPLTERLRDNYKFLKSFKNDIDSFTEGVKMSKQ